MSRVLASPDKTSTIEWLELSNLSIGVASRHRQTNETITEVNIVDESTELLFAIVSNFSLHGLKKLQISELGGAGNPQFRLFESRCWKDLLSHMRTVETLRLSSYDVPHEFAILYRVTTNTRYQPPDPKKVALPNVKRIYIDHCSFDEKSQSKKDVNRRLFTESLRWMLEVREKNGAKVEELVLDGCRDLRESDIASLREVVDVVVK